MAKRSPKWRKGTQGKEKNEEAEVGSESSSSGTSCQGVLYAASTLLTWMKLDATVEGLGHCAWGLGVASGHVSDEERVTVLGEAGRAENIVSAVAKARNEAEFHQCLRSLEGVVSLPVD